MRVVAGKLKGRRLEAPAGNRVRPTTDRVKEAMFNILGTRVADSRVLDLCCGSGALGLEALSRGACEVVFVDNSAQSLSVVQKNLLHCGIEKSSYQLVLRGIQEFLAVELARNNQRPWLFLCDPPYVSDLAAWVLQTTGQLTSDAFFRGGVVELGHQNAHLVSTDNPWECRSYGKTVLALLLPRIWE